MTKALSGWPSASSTAAIMRICSEHRTAMELVRTLKGFLMYRCPVPGCMKVRSCKLYRNGKRIPGTKNPRTPVLGDDAKDFKL